MLDFDKTSLVTYNWYVSFEFFFLKKTRIEFKGLKAFLHYSTIDATNLCPVDYFEKCQDELQLGKLNSINFDQHLGILLLRISSGLVNILVVAVVVNLF